MFRALLMQKAKSQVIGDPSFRISIDSGKSPTLPYTFKNPVTGQYFGIENVVIDWGDGTSTQLISADDKNVTAGKLTHTYPEGKVWQIKISSSDGKIPQFNFNTDILLSSVESPLCSMTARNGTPVTDFSSCSNACTSLVLVSELFTDDTIHAGSRFASAEKINFTNCFSRGSYSYGTETGSAPELWNCSFSTTPTTSGCFDGNGNSANSVSNYSQIPASWK